MVPTERPLLVVVAEDNDDMRELLVLALGGAGFVAHGVASLADARVLLADVHPDVLVADYSLPDGTGAEVLSLCHRGEATVCILLTGHAPEHVDAAGFHVVLTKPVPPATLVQAIRERVADRRAAR